MSTSPRIPVCRSISLEIPNTGYGRRGPIMAEPLPSGRSSVRDFIKLARPGVKIERLGHESMVDISAGGPPSPSSLFFRTVHAAFADHYPLALRPEVLMFLVTHTVAETVKAHPAAYQHLFTRAAEGAEKQEIRVRHDGLVRGQTSPWDKVFPLFDTALRKAVPAGIMEHMLPGFSTATAEADIAAMVSFMDAASPYYRYTVETLCGIPEIRLLGTAADWQKLKVAVAQLAEAFDGHLHAYFQHLLPVVNTLASQANGEPQDDDFWKSIYKHHSGSGSETFNGWLSAFVNYVQVNGALVAKNEAAFDWKNIDAENCWRMPGIAVGAVPSHVAAVDFIWDYFGTKIPMEFLGGIIGVEGDGGYLTPQLSYAVVEKG